MNEKFEKTLLNLKEFTDQYKRDLQYLKLVNQNIIISTTDLSGKIKTVSQAFLDVSGYSEEELIGKSHNIVRHPEVKQEFFKDMWDKLEKEGKFSSDIKNLDKNGKTFWINTNISKISCKEGIEGYIAIGINVTEKKLLEEESYIDVLTKIFNRKKIDEELEKKHNLYLRGNKIPFSMLILDVDFFKKINDEHGHPVGDIILTEFSDLLKKSVRNVDIVARWGGEEFCILLDNSTIKEAKIVAEKILSKVQNKVFFNNLKITCSIGIAEYQDEIDKYSILKKADKNLYISKTTGRNKIT